MGSLLPGWEANNCGLPPPELRDTEEKELEPAGYFKKLEIRKLERRSLGADPHSEVSHSEELHAARVSVSPPRVKHPAFSKTKSEHISRTPMMNWEEELSTLRHSHSAKHPVEGPAGQHATPAKPHGWWEQLEGGALNEHPDESMLTELRHGEHHTFIPQFLPGQRSPGAQLDKDEDSRGVL